jgi:hypothetical protein
MRKNDLVASPVLREGWIVGGKLESMKKIPKTS